MDIFSILTRKNPIFFSEQSVDLLGKRGSLGKWCALFETPSALSAARGSRETTHSTVPVAQRARLAPALTLHPARSHSSAAREPDAIISSVGPTKLVHSITGPSFGAVDLQAPALHKSTMSSRARAHPPNKVPLKSQSVLANCSMG